MSYRIRTRAEHYERDGPKRILSLDGGGIRGILTLGFLEAIEGELRKRHGGGEGFRLCHYFDLIAGTSTGSIIAAALAKGMLVEEIVQEYLTLGSEVFERAWFRWGKVLARYDHYKLVRQLKRVLGAKTTLGGDELQTGLLVMTKRLDTGSPWPLGNNPKGTYYSTPQGKNWIANAEYPLWKVVRASTAAPTYFDPERITIVERPGHAPVVGEFVDGGVSPFNNPALQALMYATLNGFRVQWDTGADKLLLVSVGTGSPDPRRTPARIAVEGGLKAMLSLMDDCTSLVETMMQWMSSSSTARAIDSEIGSLDHDLLGPEPLLTYVRYNLNLTEDSVTPLKGGMSPEEIEELSEMDRPENMGTLRELGQVAAQRQVKAAHFPPAFDLTN